MEQQKHIYCIVYVILAKSTDTEPFVQARLYTPYFLYNSPPIAPKNANVYELKIHPRLPNQRDNSHHSHHAQGLINKA